jgi:hypothetical protein
MARIVQKIWKKNVKNGVSGIVRKNLEKTCQNPLDTFLRTFKHPFQTITCPFRPDASFSPHRYIIIKQKTALIPAMHHVNVKREAKTCPSS